MANANLPINRGPAALLGLLTAPTPVASLPENLTKYLAICVKRTHVEVTGEADAQVAKTTADGIACSNRHHQIVTGWMKAIKASNEAKWEGLTYQHVSEVAADKATSLAHAVKLVEKAYPEGLSGAQAKAEKEAAEKAAQIQKAEARLGVLQTMLEEAKAEKDADMVANLEAQIEKVMASV